MLYNPNYEEIKRRMTAFWEHEALERCCVAFDAPRLDKPAVKKEKYYYEVEKADAINREYFASRVGFGENMNCIFPYFGTAGIAEYTGCKVTYTPKTAWFDPWMTEEADATLITYRHPEIFRKQADSIARQLELSQGDYLVSVSDNAGIIDALASIRGSEELLMDMLTDPEFVEESLQRLLPIYKQTEEELFDLVKENNQGSILAWMNMWAPKRFAQMQCDLSVMISNDMFNRFVMPELEELSSWLDYPLYHFDGMEQVRHLDSLLSIEKLRAIQWVCVAGQPSPVEFIPVLQKIQKAGKGLVIQSAQPHEAIKLLDNLSCRSLHLMISGVKNVEEGMELMKLIEKHSKDRKL